MLPLNRCEGSPHLTSDFRVETGLMAPNGIIELKVLIKFVQAKSSLYELDFGNTIGPVAPNTF